MISQIECHFVVCKRRQNQFVFSKQALNILLMYRNELSLKNLVIMDRLKKIEKLFNMYIINDC